MLRGRAAAWAQGVKSLSKRRQSVRKGPEPAGSCRLVVPSSPHRAGLLGAFMLIPLLVGGCSWVGSATGIWNGGRGDLGVPASPRVMTGERSFPKGGGVYKLGRPYMVAGRWYYPREQPGYDRIGVASWYGRDFHGRRTSNGEIYDMHALTAAHPTLPLPSYAYVTNLANGRTLLVRVNDRGPYVADRIIDLSYASASTLGLTQRGLGRVRVRYAGRAPLSGDDRRERAYLASQRGAAVHSTASVVPPGDLNSAPPQRSASRMPQWSPFAYRSQLR